jgi:hypothetical protein
MLRACLRFVAALLLPHIIFRIVEATMQQHKSSIRGPIIIKNSIYLARKSQQSERRQSGYMFPLCLRFGAISQQIPFIEVKMSVKPYQSTLIPYEDEILSLRHQRPPVPYAEIAKVLQQNHQITVCRQTIFKFIKVRSRGRKAYVYRRNPGFANAAAIGPASKSKDSESKDQPSAFFSHKPGDRYSPTRLSPEEAARQRNKLEEEGH